MIKNRALKLLKSLPTEEFRWFYKFVKSPYHNANKHLVKLYELLRKYYPTFDHPKLTPEFIYKKLFPGESFDIQRFRLILHRFGNLIEVFLVNQELKTDHFFFKKTLTKRLGTTNTYELFEKRTMELLEEVNASPIIDEHFLQNKVELNLQYYAHPATNRQRKGMENLIAAMESLDDYFILSKLKLACALRARQRTLSERFDIRYLDVALNKSNSSNLLISIYSSILVLQDAYTEVSIFQDIKYSFVSNIEAIGEDDQKTILQLLLNYCTRLANTGDETFVHYTLELYKIGLHHEAIFINEKLSETTFINIVSSGIGAGDFEWTESFINDYGQYLDDINRSDAITYSWAIWHFRQNNFETTRELLLNYQFNKPLQIILSKAILIRTYVELFLDDDSYYDFSIAQINTFEKYIRNNKFIPEATSSGYLKFARHTKKFVNLKSQGRKLKELEQKITKDQGVRLKRWLLNKLKK